MQCVLSALGANAAVLLCGIVAIAQESGVSAGEFESCNALLGVERERVIVVHGVSSLIFVFDAAECDPCPPHSWVAFLEDALEELFEACFGL